MSIINGQLHRCVTACLSSTSVNKMGGSLFFLGQNEVRGFLPAADVLFWLASKKDAKNGHICPSGCPRLTDDEYVSLLRYIAACRPFDLQIGDTLLIWYRGVWFKVALDF